METIRPLPLLTNPISARDRVCTCPACNPSLYDLSRHPFDDRPHRRSTALGVWQHDCYHLADLAVQSFCRGSPRFVFSQHHAKQLWRIWRFDSLEYQLMSTCNDLRRMNEAILRKPAEVFNQMFFLGQLPSSILRIRWCPEFDSTTQGTTHGDENLSVVLLNPSHEMHRLCPTGLLCTLLHEMCHAYLGRYSCFRSESCGTDECRRLWRDNYGVTGHGRAFQFLAKAIEDSASALLSGFDAHLGRAECAFWEIERGGFQPWSACDLEMWFDEGCQVVLRAWMRSRDDDHVLNSRLKVWAGARKQQGIRRRRSVACLRQKSSYQVL